MKPVLSIILIVILLSSISSQSITNNSTLATDSLKSTNFLPDGAYGIMKDTISGRISCFLPQNMDINGILCRGGMHNNWMTSFWANGQLATCWLAEDQEIQGIPVMAATTWIEFFRWLPGINSARVEFHSNGQVKRCKLAKDVVLQGTHFSKGDVILLDEHGNLIDQ